jgi:hypothetical protein
VRERRRLALGAWKSRRPPDAEKDQASLPVDDDPASCGEGAAPGRLRTEVESVIVRDDTALG